MKFSMNYIKRVLLACLGGIFLGVGVSLFVKANIGLEAMSLWMDGLSKTFNITFGQASLLNTGLQIILALVLARKNVNIGTVISAIIVSPIIDFMLPLLYRVIGPENGIVLTVILFLGSQICIGIAISTIIGAGVGMTLLDAVIYRVMDITNKQYKTIKIINDVILVICGFALGGSLGIGTVASAIISGPIVGFMIVQGQKRVFSNISFLNENKVEVAC